MTKSGLVSRLAAKNPHLTQSEVDRIVSTIFKEITNALARGDRVELRGFGSFALRSHGVRIGRNPRTGVVVHVPRKTAQFFRTGKELRAQLNANSGGALFQRGRHEPTRAT